jgi:hypothetical protein
VNWEGFLQAVTEATVKEGDVWDPIKGRAHPWLRVEKLGKLYNHSTGGSGKCAIM